MNVLNFKCFFFVLCLCKKFADITIFQRLMYLFIFYHKIWRKSIHKTKNLTKSGIILIRLMLRVNFRYCFTVYLCWYRNFMETALMMYWAPELVRNEIVMDDEYRSRMMRSDQDWLKLLTIYLLLKLWGRETKFKSV